jgi:hypothetical protein
MFFCYLQLLLSIILLNLMKLLHFNQVEDMDLNIVISGTLGKNIVLIVSSLHIDKAP